VKCGSDGRLSADEIAKHIDRETAALLLTNPNTLGIFETEVQEICSIAHDEGALVYMDGANLNALLGISRPADMGFDIVHFNLHKTFSAPHGGGGPGSGPIGVTEQLEPFLPVPVLVQSGDGIEFEWDRRLSIGKVQSFYGNAAVALKAYCYIRMMGARGLADVSRNAILNANYLRSKLKELLVLPYDAPCQHEFVLSAVNAKKHGVRALDIAKRLLDYGFHAPTMYFPLLVKEALMIEPTETESLDTLNDFADAMTAIWREVEADPDKLTGAPWSTPVRRLDEAKAAKDLDVCWDRDHVPEGD
jgi:glycine dehydrogenase subunit 2